MSDSEFLSQAELHDLTGFARAAEQEAWLRTEGVAHRRSGKRVIVSRFHARAWLEGKEAITSEGPNWGALNA